MLACLSEAQAYRRASRRVRHTQQGLLKQIVTRNSDTSFGKRHRFASIQSIRDYQRAVPLSKYEDYAPSIERIARGEQNVLTSEPIDLLEPTSGTISGEKLIPYTAALRRSFQRAIRVWIGDLFSNRPSVRRGKAYWSISPLGALGRTTPSGIPVGFDDDTAYLAGFERRLLARTLAVPPEVALCTSVESAQYATLFFLLRCPCLSLISIWSPTFLTELLICLRVHRDQLCEDVERGEIAADHAKSLPSRLTDSFGSQCARAHELRRILTNPETDTWPKQIWPQLSMVSCWADGPSSGYAERLRRIVSGVEIQPKGLLATEAIVSIPLLSQPGAALAVRSHFYEFQSADSMGTTQETETVLADELRLGKQYQVIVTTGGGLYRYQLMDQVEVVGFYAQTPLLRFMGKCDDVTDLVGEKLSAAHVQTVLGQAIKTHGLSPTFIELVARPGDKPCYLLRLVDGNLATDERRQADLCESVDRGLRSNPGYRYARDLGQLGQPRIVTLCQDQADDYCTTRTTKSLQAGMRHGNIKPSILSKSDNSDANLV